MQNSRRWREVTWAIRPNALGQWQGPLPSSIWTRYRVVKWETNPNQGKVWEFVGTTAQGKGKESSEGGKRSISKAGDTVCGGQSALLLTRGKGSWGGQG